MGWAERANPRAQDKKKGLIKPKNRKTRLQELRAKALEQRQNRMFPKRKEPDDVHSE